LINSEGEGLARFWERSWKLVISDTFTRFNAMYYKIIV
jgi:hypothetical protein